MDLEKLRKLTYEHLKFLSQLFEEFAFQDDLAVDSCAKIIEDSFNRTIELYNMLALEQIEKLDR